MNKVVKYLFAAASAFAVVACAQNDEQFAPAPGTKTITFTADALPSEDTPDTRAGYAAGVGTHWDAGDVVYVYVNNENTHVEFTQQEGTLANNGRTVVYEATIAVADPNEEITALYLPAQTRTGNPARVMLPANQTYVEDGYTQIPLVGKASTVVDGESITSGNMQFKNYFSVLKFSLTGDVLVNKIVVTDKAGQQIAGKVVVYPNNEAEKVVKQWDGDSSTSITLNCGGVALGETAKDFYVVVPSKNLAPFTEGLDVEIYTNAGQVAKSTSTVMSDLAENTIYTLPQIDVRAAAAKKIVPDATFRTWLKENGFVSETNEETGEVVIAESYTTFMSVKKSNLGDAAIATFQGVEHFANLTKLEIVGWSASCNDSTFDISNMTNLQNLIVNGNNLVTLNLSKNTAVTQIYCYSNDMTELDIRMLGDAVNVRAGKQSGGTMTVYMRSGQTNSAESNSNNEGVTWNKK